MGGAAALFVCFNALLNAQPPGTGGGEKGRKRPSRVFQCAPERAAPGDLTAWVLLHSTYPRFNALLNAQPPGTS